MDFKDIIKDYESVVPKLYTDTALAYFNATTTGNEKEFAKAAELQKKLNLFFANKEKFEAIKNLHEGDNSLGELEKRQVLRLYNEFAGNQYDDNLLKRIVQLSTDLEEKYSKFRAVVDGKTYTDNKLDEILETSTDSNELKKVWESSKQIGKEVEGDVISLAKLRNKAAKDIGYHDHHVMSMALAEQDQDDMDALFDELDMITRDEFADLKAGIDTKLSKKYNVPVNELMPWHYQDKYFQHGPKVYDVDFDKYFKDQDVVELTRKYFNGIDLNIDEMLAKSDLYEKEGKYQHAYCTDIDRNTGDIRVLCNVKPNYRWMGTMLHEFGHAVYDRYVDRSLPWNLREHAHIFTTEAIAMLFGRLASNPDWLYDMGVIDEEAKTKIADESYQVLKLEQLTFSRWVQVMYRFEREFYINPNQDLNSLWWDLVEEFQMIRKPEGRNMPDYAAKIHVALYPAYYHNYMLGELLASQLFIYIMNNIVKTGSTSFANNKEVGKYLKENVFEPGAKYHWSQMITKATGEPLNPKYYAAQFIS